MIGADGKKSIPTLDGYPYDETDHPIGCVCDDCTITTGKTHAEADVACGREWTCQCGACKRARKLNIDRAFAKLEETEAKLVNIKAIKAL